MALARRSFLRLTAGTAAALLPGFARSQSYPARPVRVVVGFAAGGATDIAARLIGQSLGNRLGQQFVIVNRPGASGNIAAETVINAVPDGYTLLAIGTPNAVNAALYDNLSFNFVRDIVPIAGVMRVPNVMLVNSALPARTVTEFIAYAEANPGKVTFGSGGIGTSLHMAAELFKLLAGVGMVHVPYRGEAPALTDLLGNQVSVVFATTTASIEHIKAGKLRAPAVTTAVRSPILPDVPTVSEFVPGYEASFWTGLAAPKACPVQVIEMLNSEINAALADATIKARFADLGATVLAGSPADFSKLIVDETDKWARVIRVAKIKAE